MKTEHVSKSWSFITLTFVIETYLNRAPLINFIIEVLLNFSYSHVSFVGGKNCVPCLDNRPALHLKIELCFQFTSNQ